MLLLQVIVMILTNMLCYVTYSFSINYNYSPSKSPALQIRLLPLSFLDGMLSEMQPQLVNPH